MRNPFRQGLLGLSPLVATIGALQTIACAPAQTPPASDSASVASLRAQVDSLLARITTAAVGGDESTLVATLSDHYVSLETPGQAVTMPAYRAFIDTMLSGGRFIELAYEPLGTHFSGNLAVYYGHARIAYEPKTGQPWRMQGNYVHVFRREDGVWRLVTEIVNSTTPPPVLPATPARN